MHICKGSPVTSRKRLYGLTYRGGLAAFFDDAGHLLKASGTLWQGMDLNVLTLMPTACPDGIQDDPSGIHVLMPSLDEWTELLKRTDDPVFFQEDSTGTLKTVVRKAQYAISGAIQQRIWVRDQFLCLYCGQPMGKVQMTVDHFVPLEVGGGNTQENLISCCRACNKRKGKEEPESWCKRYGYDYEGLKGYLEGRLTLAWISHLTIY